MAAVTTPASGQQVPATGEVRLDEWVARHGPLSPMMAATLALHLCAEAARRSDALAARTWPSLDVAHIWRGDDGVWEWRAGDDRRARRRPRDADVLERVGLVLFHSLTGVALPYRIADAQSIRSHLRAARPDLAPPLAQVVVRALTAHEHPDAGLDGFARDLRQWLGVEAARPARAPWTRRIAIGVTAVGLALASWLATARPGREVALSSGLSVEDLALADAAAEYADYLAITDEHTAALVLYQRMQRLWHTRVPPTDPRMTRLVTFEAWVRELQRDDLTTGQLLSDKPEMLTTQLGVHHPYTRAAGLVLAGVLSRSGERARAERLKELATQAAHELLQEAPLVDRILVGPPAAPGVIAHVAPNDPAVEGFRARDQSWTIPLTSTQRWFAGELSWRLHVRATGACEVAVDLGVDARRMGVGIAPVDAGWRVWSHGLTPAMEMSAPRSGGVGVSLGADGDDPVTVTLGTGRSARSRVDVQGTPPTPPFELRFSGSGCALVWLEVAFPPHSQRPPLPWLAEPVP